jgi:hypothetical protein
MGGMEKSGAASEAAGGNVARQFEKGMNPWRFLTLFFVILSCSPLVEQSGVHNDECYIGRRRRYL